MYIMRKLLFIGALMLGIGLQAQNATYENGILTLDNVDYTVVESSIASYTADFSATVDDYDHENSRLSLYSSHHVNAGESNLFARNTGAVEGVNYRYSRGSYQLWMHGDRFVRNGRWVFHLEHVSLFDWNSFPPRLLAEAVNGGIPAEVLDRISLIVNGSSLPQRLGSISTSEQTVVTGVIPDGLDVLDDNSAVSEGQIVGLYFDGALIGEATVGADRPHGGAPTLTTSGTITFPRGNIIIRQ